MIKLHIPQVKLAAFAALLGVISAVFAQFATAADPLVARVPHNAYNKSGRDDLQTPLAQQGELRVLVGLQTPDEIRQNVDITPDDAKEQAVSRRQQRLLQRLAGHNVRNVRALRFHHFVAMTVDAGALNALLADPDVTSVSEDRPRFPVLNDTPGITHADQAWAQGFRGAGQVVAILDTGVDKTHPFFSGKVVAEACFSHPVGSNTSYCPGGVAQSTAAGSGTPCADYSLGCWHGTHVAGIATGRTGVLSATGGGMAPDAGVMPIQVFQRICSGNSCSIAAYDSDIVAALDYVYSQRGNYNIASVNLSLGGDVYTAQCDASLPSYTTVVANLRNANIATVIAAGNNGNAGAISAPGCLSNAISVGSTSKQLVISGFSNSAGFLSLLAPGESITSSVPLAYSAGGFGGASGTSMAAPHVAGTWALLKSAQPAATVSQVLSALQSTGVPITDPRSGITKSFIQITNANGQGGALQTLRGSVSNAPPAITLSAPANNAVYTAPATVNVSATASDSDGAISKVEFYRDGALISTVTTPASGTASSGTWSYNDTDVAAGAHTYTAKAYDNAGGVTSAGVATINVSAAGNTGSVNVASQVNGGIATASSTFNSAYPASGANDGDRAGANWENGGGWNDATNGAYPDWLQVNFNGAKSISEVDVFTVQDNYAAPATPTSAMTFSQYGITAFQIQYWTGAAWADIPGGNITGNNLVWRRVSFAPVTTDRIRVLVNSSLAGYSRIVEVEAWSGGGTGGGSINAAAQANGGIASASSTYDSGFAAAGANNGDRKGLNWAAGGGWNDSSVSAYPDWLQINFSSVQSIGEVDVFTVQDNYGAPIDPTPATTFSQYGITDFQVQYWTGTAWADVPGGNISGNNLVWRRLTFAPVSTDRIRVLVNSALSGYSRIVEVEAWTASSGTALKNAAAQVNGGTASASSSYNAFYTPAGANNGDRKGLNWANGGGWNDSTNGVYPDWLQINFAGVQSIGEIDVFTVQDNYQSPSDPTPSMTFTQWGITAFQVQYWTGAAWADVPGGNITGNNLVWRRLTFAPVSTDRIRVLVNSALSDYSRIVELEAWAN